MARSKAPLRIVPRVPMTPTWPLTVVATAALAPGRITPVTGTGWVLCSAGIARAEAVLQATTIILACSASRSPLISTEYRSMVPWLFPP